jgi:TatA/E family protein of Tat protein translocase
MIPGPSELLIIAGVALLLFGPSKLPQLGSAIGESIRNFRKGMKPVDGTDSQEAPLNSQALLTQQTTSSTQVPSSANASLQVQNVVVEHVRSDPS